MREGEELAPCPFCGGAAKEVEIETCVSPFYAIRCVNPRCRITPWTGYLESREEARDAWSTRTGCPATVPDDGPLECLHAEPPEGADGMSAQAEARAKSVAKAILSDCREIGVDRAREAMVRGIDSACGHVRSAPGQRKPETMSGSTAEIADCRQPMETRAYPMNGNVRSWYLSSYPEDRLGSSINEDATFIGILSSLSLGEDLVCAVGVSEGTVRSRVFNRIGELSGHPASDVYNLWVTCGRVNAFGDVMGEAQ